MTPVTVDASMRLRNAPADRPAILAATIQQARARGESCANRIETR